MVNPKKKYYLDALLIRKLDKIIERSCNHRELDAVLICDGDEGFGKTGISILALNYIAEKTGREFNLDHIFFDAKEFIRYINNTKKQLILWDEGALGGLASNWQSKIQQKLVQTLMTCRYRQHVIIFNCPKFYRLNSYFIMDRAVGLIHVYSRDNITAGRFSYYKKDYLEAMTHYWSSKRKKPYKKFGKLRGSFPDAFRFNIIDKDEYIKKKDYYTSKILEEYDKSPVTVKDEKLIKLQYYIYTLPGMILEEKEKHFKINKKTIAGWKRHIKNYPELFKEDKEDGKEE